MLRTLTNSTALLIHHRPEETLLDSILSVCGKLVVLDPTSTSELPGRNERVITYTCDPENLVPYALELCKKHKVNVVPAIWEGSVEITATICSALNIKGNPIQSARLARDKYSAARKFADADVPHPLTIGFDINEHNPKLIEQRISYPFIVKLPRSTNSHAVMLVSCRNELETAVTMFKDLYDPNSPNRLYNL